MKKLFFFSVMLLTVLLLMLVLVSCGEQTPATTEESTTQTVETTPATTEKNSANGLPIYVDDKLFVIEDGKTNYSVVFQQGSNLKSTTGEMFNDALAKLRKAFKNYGYQKVSITNDAIPLGEEDTFVAPEFEILIGNTNREESNVLTDELAFNQAVIRVVGKKIVITGKNDVFTAKAVLEFIEKYMPENGKAVLVPADLNEVLSLDLVDCSATDMTYAAMAKDVWDSFNEAYWNGYYVEGDFWHQAEMIETYIDVYEATKSEADKERMLTFADNFLKTRGGSWLGNEYNDDIMWICIAFSRISHLTGDAKYIKFAKQNFDQVWRRAWDEKLGGGLYWRTDNKTKNACVNGPAAIAACLIGDYYNDNNYYDKAKQIMKWEIEVLFDANTGRVYDAIKVTGGKDAYASTYNQGTFIGACTLLYQHTKDKQYLTYAGKAANFAMGSLTDNGVIIAEDSGNDLPGFKGILTRWLYRYAKEVEDLNVLFFLQKNAAIAYQNRNKDGLIWTNWAAKTSDDPDVVSKYLIFGMSTSVSLMYNCQQWW